MASLSKLVVVLEAHTARFSRNIGRAGKRMGAFTRRIRSGAAAMGLLAARMVKLALVAATALSVRVAARFEQVMARVKALTEATGDEFKRLSDLAKELGSTTVHSASQAAQAMSAFALAGFSTNQILQAMRATLDLASAGQLEVGQAADIAAKLMAGMGIQAGDLGNAVDVMTKAFTTSNTNLEMLGEAMAYLGPIARTAGKGLEETVAAIQVVSNAGIQGQKAGAGLRKMLLSLTSPSAEAASLLKKLGTEVNDAAGNMRPLADIISDLQHSLGGLGTGERLGVLGRIFGARGATVAAAMIAAGADKLRVLESALDGAAGASRRIAAVQMDTLIGSWVRLKSAAEGLGIAIGETLIPPMRRLVDLMTTATNTWKLLPAAWDDITDRLAAGMVIAGMQWMNAFDVTWTVLKNMWSGFASHVLSGIDTIRGGFLTGLAWMAENFEDFVNRLIRGVNKVIGGLNKLPGIDIDLIKLRAGELSQGMRQAAAEYAAEAAKHRQRGLDKIAQRTRMLEARLNQRQFEADLQVADIFAKVVEVLDPTTKRGRGGGGDGGGGGGGGLPALAAAFQTPAALERGSVGAYSAGVQASYRGQAAFQKAQAETAKNTKDAVKELQGLRGDLGEKKEPEIAGVTS